MATASSGNCFPVDIFLVDGEIHERPLHGWSARALRPPEAIQVRVAGHFQNPFEVCDQSNLRFSDSPVLTRHRVRPIFVGDRLI
jgi:hypothetical protein